MTNTRLEDLNIKSSTPLITPEKLKAQLPASDSAITSIESGRNAIRDILERKDHRLFVVIGPCSIHDVKAAKEYAVASDARLF